MRLNHTHVIALANQKGGCGKSTAAISLAAAFTKLGYSAALVDIDPQCNTTDHLGLDRDAHAEQGGLSLADVYLAGVPATEVQTFVPPWVDEETPDANPVPGGERGIRPWIVPGNRGLGTVEKRLEADMQASAASPLDADELRDAHRRRLRDSLDSLRGVHDFIIIDTPPELGFLMTTALIAADWLLIPTFPSGYDMKGLTDLARTAEKVRHRFNPDLELIGVLLGNFNHVAKLDKDLYENLKQTFGEGVLFETTINTSVRHREATVYNRTIFEHAPNQPASKQFAQVAGELLGRIEAWETERAATGRPQLTINQDVIARHTNPEQPEAACA
ncbi:MAG: ParA family protein [Planctomycetota bacterium]